MSFLNYLGISINSEDLYGMPSDKFYEMLKDSSLKRTVFLEHDKDDEDCEFKFKFTSLVPEDPNHIRKAQLVDKYELDYLRHRADFACKLLQKMYEEMFDNYHIQGSCTSLDAYEYMVNELIRRDKERKESFWNKLKNKISNGTSKFRKNSKQCRDWWPTL